MKQLFENYRDNKKLAPLVRELPWTHNLLILGKAKSNEEKEFYNLQQIEAQQEKPVPKGEEA